MGPGPGVVLVIAGASLTNSPGRRPLRLRLMRMPWVLNPINRLRDLFWQPPLRMPVPSKNPQGAGYWMRDKTT